MNKSGAEEQHRIHVQQLFVKHQGVLKGYVLGLVPEFASAEDVLQEVFLTVTAKAGQCEEGSNFVARAALRVCLQKQLALSGKDLI